MNERIFVVEDEEGLLMTLQDRLEDEWYRVVTEANGARAEEKARNEAFDLIVLDIMLPGRDGFQICRNLRSSDIQTPILVLTARSSDIDTIMGLRIGADDYLAKPFDMQVLLARIVALLRRAGIPKKARAIDGSIYSFGSFILDTRRQQLSEDGRSVALNAQEYRLLKFLVENPDRVISRDELLNEVWGYETETTTRTVDVHVAWLRQKLKERRLPKHVVTVRGYGYKFVPEQ
jgi:DNA-binding response OmpR family regulator